MKARFAGLLVAAVSLPASAQQAPGNSVITNTGQSQPAQAKPAKSAAAPAVEDVIVTARRRNESLSKVPITIAAISAQQLAARSIQSENDLQSAVPGLTIRQNGNANTFNYAIRGQSVDTFSMCTAVTNQATGAAA